MQREAAASCSELVRIYWSATDEVHALKGIDATFPVEQLTAVVGGSGSGKSTLLRILALIDRPTAGRVLLGGTDTTVLSTPQRRRFRRERIGYLFQSPTANLIPDLTARQQLDVAYRSRAGGDAYGPSVDLLEAVGLAERAEHLPRQLSGGEQQRLAVACAVIGDPALVVADEPTAELDSVSGARVIDVIRDLARRGTAFVVATHDPVVMQAADRVLHLRHGALEAESGEEGRVSIIDPFGRLQLPTEALEKFPDRRAVVHVEDDQIRITPP